MKKAVIAFLTSILPVSAWAQVSAQEWAETAQQRYDARDYDGAAQAWQKSYELSQKPGLLYNMAQARRLAGRCVEALTTYRAFIRFDPTSTKRSLAEGFIAELTPKCEERKTALAHSDAGRAKRIVGLAVAGAGAALFGFGLYYGYEASVLDRAVTAACADGCVWEEVQNDVERGERYASRQWTFYGFGTAAIIAGTVAYYLGWRDGRHEAVTVAPAGGGAVVSWTGVW